MTAPCALCRTTIHWSRIGRQWTALDAGGAVHRCYRSHYEAIAARKSAAVAPVAAERFDPLAGESPAVEAKADGLFGGAA
jgi:hypothetical protein